MKTTKETGPAHFPHGDVTRSILVAFYAVYNALGNGFLERVYVRALAEELRSRGLSVALEVPLEVRYHGVCVGTYRADCVVAGSVIVEVKAASRLASEHEAQLLHYLRSSDIEVGLLLNFGVRPSFKRLAFSNQRKTPRRL